VAVARLAEPDPRAPAPHRRRPERGVTSRWSRRRGAPPIPPPLRADRARQALVAELPAAGPVAALVRDAMARDGDSDPRLLGLFAAVGLRPTALAGAAGAVDPWLAAGLVDLERQVVDRCPECGWDLEDAAAGLVAEVSDPALACLVEGVATRDPRRV
jgi:hypothetical protein